MILREEPNNVVTFLGTGFFCDRRGYILTCAHTVNLTDKICFAANRTDESFIPMTLKRTGYNRVKIVQFDPINDVALLKFESYAPLHFDVSTDLLETRSNTSIGSSMAYLGYPFGQNGLHTLQVSSTIIGAKIISESNTKQFQLDAMVHEGNSGGPLFDVASGKIVGLISGRFSPVGNEGGMRFGTHIIGSESSISFATSIEYGIELLKSEGIR